jgi:hypothetical protein
MMLELIPDLPDGVIGVRGGARIDCDHGGP